MKSKLLKAVSFSMLSMYLVQSFAITAFANTTATITVDYATDVGPSNHVASGFLHGISASSPAQYLIDGVTVKAIRGADYETNLPDYFDQTTYNRVKATGADLMVGLYYRAKQRGVWPVDATTEAQWQSIVEEIYNEAQSKNYNIKSWITWNEPQLQWNTSTRTIAKYMRAHELAYKKIKSLNSAALVQAPENHVYSFSFITSFLTYCKQNNCLPDILSWHELAEGQLDIEAHTAEIKAWMITNGITPMPIAVTEYQGQNYDPATTSTSYPGLNISYLARLERSVANGLAYGLKSAWEFTGEDTNFKASLGDLADRNTALLPKGIWWVYNGYKDMTGRLVQTTSSNKQYSEAFASLDSSMDRSVVLLGTGNFLTPHDPVLQLNNIPGVLKYGSKTHVKAEKIINAGILMAPEVVIDADYTVTNNALTLNLPTLDPKAAYRVYVTSATADAPKTSYEAENLTAISTPGVTFRSYSESTASAGAAVSLDATGTNQNVTFTMNIPTAGTYNLGAILKKGNNRGFFQLYVDGVAYGSPKDSYNSTLAYYSTDFGAIKFNTAGNHTFEFRTVGKNSSSSNYWMVFDKFELIKMN
ncbi:hypothetical protein [Paenibacillus ferrarius]|uniref:hypothetical protein n=1 Tax=Paenibacillus ferrarius TaxID=1469647 RepID=UPI003D2D42B5